MTKVAILIYTDTQTAESMGRVANAFMLALEAIEASDELKIIFEGAGTRWIGELEKNDHKLHDLYMGLKEKITGVCSFCAEAYGVKSQVQKAEVKLLSDFKGHPSVRKLINDGFEIVTF